MTETRRTCTLTTFERVLCDVPDFVCSSRQFSEIVCWWEQSFSVLVAPLWVISACYPTMLSTPFQQPSFSPGLKRQARG